MDEQIERLWSKNFTSALIGALEVMADPMTNPMTLEIRITFIHKNQCPWNIYYYLEPVLLLTFRTVWNTYQCYLKLTEKHVRDDTVLLNSLNTK